MFSKHLKPGCKGWPPFEQAAKVTEQDKYCVKCRTEWKEGPVLVRCPRDGCGSRGAYGKLPVEASKTHYDAGPPGDARNDAPRRSPTTDFSGYDEWSDGWTDHYRTSQQSAWSEYRHNDETPSWSPRNEEWDEYDDDWLHCGTDGSESEWSQKAQHDAQYDWSREEWSEDDQVRFKKARKDDGKDAGQASGSSDSHRSRPWKSEWGQPKAPRAPREQLPPIPERGVSSGSSSWQHSSSWSDAAQGRTALTSEWGQRAWSQNPERHGLDPAEWDTSEEWGSKQEAKTLENFGAWEEPKEAKWGSSDNSQPVGAENRCAEGYDNTQHNPSVQDTKPYGFWAEPDSNPPPGLVRQLEGQKSECAARGRHTDGWPIADPCYIMDNSLHTPACNWEQSYTSMNMQQGDNILKHLQHHGTFGCYVHKGASNRAYGVVCLVCGQVGHAYLGGARDCEVVDGADDVFVRFLGVPPIRPTHKERAAMKGQPGQASGSAQQADESLKAYLKPMPPLNTAAKPAYSTRGAP